MKNVKLDNSHKGLIIGIIVLSAILLVSCWYIIVRLNGSNPSQEIYSGFGPSIVQGIVISINLEPMTRDGSGVIIIQNESGEKYVVNLRSGMSNCDRDAITIPENLAENKTVEVRGILDGHKSLVICETGTYIKMQ